MSDQKYPPSLTRRELDTAKKEWGEIPLVQGCILPGKNHPHYNRVMRRLALWAYAHGPFLIDLGYRTEIE